MAMRESSMAGNLYGAQEVGTKRAVALFLVVVAAFFIGSFNDIWVVGSRWMDFTESYSDGWLMFAIAIFLTVRQFKIAPPATEPQPLWLLPLFAMVFFSVLSAWIYVEVIQDFFLVPMLLAALAAVWGWRQLQRFLIPIGLLAMVTPFWDFLDWPLQLITVQANKVLLGFWGIKFHVESVYIYLHGVGAIEVAGGCSGLRYLIVAISLCLIYGHLSFKRWRTIAKFVATGAAFGIVTNWVRVYVVTLVAYESDMKASLVRHHDFFGWALFGVILIPLFWLGSRYAQKEARLEEAEPQNLGASITAKPKSNTLVWTTVVAAVVLLLSPRIIDVMRPVMTSDTPPAMNISLSDGWLQAFSGRSDGWKPVSYGASVVNWKHWVKMGTDNKAIGSHLSTYVATYKHQSPGKEMIQYGNYIFNRNHWAPKATYQIKGKDGRTYQAIQLERRPAGRKIYIAYTYYVSGLWLTNDVEAKLAQVVGLFTGRHDNSLIAVGLDCGQCQAPKAELRDAMDQLTAQVRSGLDAYQSK